MTSQENLEIPEIFRLIKGNASDEELVQQIQRDVGDRERAFLGLEELARRGSKEHLRLLAGQQFPYAKAVQYLCKKPGNRWALEEMLGIKRHSEPLDPSALLDSLSIRRVHRLALERGYTSIAEAADFLRDHQSKFRRYASDKMAGRMPQDTGTIEEEIINISPTFGSLEPIYLETHNPREILDFRSLSRPTFLVIGTVRQYQALEFYDFVKKINPDGVPVVLEIRKDFLDAVLENMGEKKMQLIIGDVFNPSFRERSFDAAYTNQIFRSLTLGSREGERMIDVYDDANAQIVFDRMYRVFKFVYDTLKPGSKFVVVEPQGQKKFGSLLKSLAEQGIAEAAQRAGFQVSALQKPFEYLFRPEISSATVNQNGFPHYGDVALLRCPKEYLVMVCQKPVISYSPSN